MSSRRVEIKRLLIASIGIPLVIMVPYLAGKWLEILPTTEMVILVWLGGMLGIILMILGLSIIGLGLFGLIALYHWVRPLKED